MADTYHNDNYLLILLFILMLIGGLLMTTNHAWITHQASAEQAENCYKQNGASFVFIDKTYKDHVRHNLCQDSYGQWYDVVTKLTGEDLSSYSPKDGTLEGIKRWIAKKAGKWLTPEQAFKEYGW